MTEGKKRKRGNSDLAPPRESGHRSGDSDEEAGASSEGAPLLCEAAQRVLSDYSLGVMRVPFEDLGVSPVNRNLSGGHVHKLGRRIVSVDGVRAVEVSAWLGARAESR